MIGFVGGGAYYWKLSGIGGTFTSVDERRTCDLARLLGPRRFLLQDEVPVRDIFRALHRSNHTVDAHVTARRKPPLWLHSSKAYNPVQALEVSGQPVKPGEALRIVDGTVLRIGAEEAIYRKKARMRRRPRRR